VRNAATEPVLLNPATGVTPEENYSWNWEPALTKLGIPWCAYTAPYHTLGDIQISGEYLVSAIRTMYALAGRRIAIIGHSQGGMSMRWPLRFWPDTRRMVEDVIGFSGTNHGTTVLGRACDGGCPPADWQQGYESNLIRALNSHTETFPGISYTEVYTHTDEVVQPATNNQTASATLTAGAPVVKAEPPLACYVFATCAPSARLQVQVSPRHAVAGRRLRVRIRVTVDVGGVISPVPRASVRIAGRRLTTNAGGTASARIKFRRRGHAAVRATATEFWAGSATMTIARRR
jgi:hypothetical protein